ncbi:ABC transporter substrate-binding protein [Actinomadura viridis]|uniref:Spermidine/putrescine transport system substrate-binding protein n=1 Tax=Actinomadura viridis TaxID=58110 RepID=A0A931GGN5_9ACTN|nr:ABC transporter substrate-binding protein [Actinomadura viridis]MBG6085982.1 putative spermidine/putrescine transport system substrate-binding protein [Actinomadura viridis]
MRDHGRGGYRPTRRQLLRGGLGGAALLGAPQLLAACGDPGKGAGGKAARVTFASNGGALQKAQEKAYLTPYMKANPQVKIVQDVGSTDYARIEAMVKSGNVTWDLVDVGGDFGTGEQEALLEPLDCNLIACTAGEGGSRYRVPLHRYASVMGYRTDKTPNPPKTWAEWFDLDAYPGKRAFFRVSGPTGIYESALLADGVPIDKLFPLDVDRAFRKLDTIRSSLIWAPSPTDTVRLLADGEVTLASVFSSQAHALAQDGAKIGVVWNEYGLGSDYLVIPKGAKNKDAAMKLAAYMTSAQNNAQLSNIYPVAPGHPNAKPDPSAPTYGFLPSGKGGTSFAYDSRYYADNQKMLARRLNEWLKK